MYGQILYTQWKWSRVALAGLAVSAFAVPALGMRLSGILGNDGPLSARDIVSGVSAAGVFFVLLAIIGPFVLAVVPWNQDAQSKHVYALSLPITWQRYLAMRFVTGVLFLIVPALMLWAGGALAVSLIQLPPTLQSYAGTIAFRFFLASLLTYGIAFALQWLAGRKSALVLLLTIFGVTVTGLVLGTFGYTRQLDAIGKFLTEWPGIFSVFAQSWMLIDV